MKKLFLFLMLLTISITPVKAESSYVVMTGDDLNIVEAENEHVPRSIASITKIMTAVVALEYGDFNDVWLVSDEVLNTTGSMIWIVPGQKVTMRSLMYGLMLKSGNDAAMEIAHRVSGSVSKFVEEMNKKAAELGMKDTVFTNPHGLDVQEAGNTSTAYDMAVLMNYAMKNPVFKEIVMTKEYRSEWGVRWKNSNKLLKDFAFCTGGKTGFTKKAGETLVTAAENQGTEFIIVTLNVPDRWTFHKEKYTQVLNEYKRVVLLEKQEIVINRYHIQIDEDFTVTANDAMLQEGELKAYLKKEKNEYVVEWTYRGNTVSKTYPAVKEKRKLCFWRWCV